MQHCTNLKNGKRRILEFQNKIMKNHAHYTFKAKIWLYHGGKAAWRFISVPKKESQQIKFFAAGPRRGWGSVPVTVTVGKTTWKTSIFPDTKSGSYLLPLKANVRKKEEISAEDTVSVSLEVKS